MIRAGEPPHVGIDLQHHSQGIQSLSEGPALQIQIPSRHSAHRIHLLPQDHIQTRSSHTLIQVTNLSGEFSLGLQAHTEHGNRATMGYLKHERKTSPQDFRRKHTGTMGDNSLPPVRNFSYDCSHKREAVPKASEKPVMGMKTSKNFIVANAVETILSSARKSESSKNWLSKKDFGKVPTYLQHIKESINNEYKMIQNLHQQNEEHKYSCLHAEIC